MQEISNAGQESSAKSTEQKVKCPNCRHTVFSRTLVEAVEIIKTKGTLTDDLVDEPQVGKELYSCVKCGSVLDLDKEVGEK